MQTYKDIEALKQRMRKDNGLYSLKDSKNFPKDKFIMGGHIYELEEYGKAKGDIDGEVYSYMKYHGNRESIYIYYMLPTDNGISWERVPFKLERIEVF